MFTRTLLSPDNPKTSWVPLAVGRAGAAGAGATVLGAGAGVFKELLTVSRMKGVSWAMMRATKSESSFLGGGGGGEVVWMTGLRVGAGAGTGWTRLTGLDLI